MATKATQPAYRDRLEQHVDPWFKSAWVYWHLIALARKLIDEGGVK